ncbi:hypothetical protein BZA05DRAFT_239288 [Tricharina praecox]|uniref:uncharacterized protein n=1 Tax=Tricharina praecox TaxID=43433 RepID=UPI00221E5C95|nr:uncharacterized protein BZA05DRAFT_239288 [Tricharina praecox]KAI5855407.1 hypothetical protein BZA05DRAFT_239288 [Tricharina praecox]
MLCSLAIVVWSSLVTTVQPAQPRSKARPKGTGTPRKVGTANLHRSTHPSGRIVPRAMEAINNVFHDLRGWWRNQNTHSQVSLLSPNPVPAESTSTSALRDGGCTRDSQPAEAGGRSRRGFLRVRDRSARLERSPSMNRPETDGRATAPSGTTSASVLSAPLTPTPLILTSTAPSGTTSSVLSAPLTPTLLISTSASPAPSKDAEARDARARDAEAKDIQHWGRAYSIAREKLDESERMTFGPQFKSSPQECILSALREADAARNDRNEQKWTYKNSAGEIISLRNRFDRIVEGIDKYAKTVDIAVNHSPEVTSLVWASARFLLQVYLNHKESIEALECALSTIITTMANCKFYSRICANALRSSPTPLLDELEAALPEFYAAVLVFSIKAKHYFAPPSYLGRVTQHLKPFSSGILPYLDDIERMKSQLKDLAEMAEMERVHDLRSEKAEGLTEELEGLKWMAISEEQALEWLAATNPETSHDLHLSKRTAGTCEWISQHKEYIAWVDGTGKKNLWIEGIPGAGKSVLAANMVPELQKLNAVVLYFFFRDGDAVATSATAMVASLVAQLIKASSTRKEKERLMPILQLWCRSDVFFKQTKSTRGFKKLWAIFTQMLH